MSANQQQNPNELGAIWKKESNGKKFYTGKLTIDGQEISIVMFQNDRKQPGSNAPDWRIYKSNRPENGGGKPAPRPQSKPAASGKPAAPKAPARPRPPAPAPAPDTSADPEAELAAAAAEPASANSTL